MNFDIESIIRKMLVKYAYFGSVTANVDYKEDISIKTAGTDGKTIYYNPQFVSKLSISEQIFLFAHEVCHIAFNHVLRSDGKDKKVWNIATDAVINAILKKDKLKMIDGVVDIEDAINYDAEQLYEKLLHEQDQNKKKNLDSPPKNNQGQPQNGQNSLESKSKMKAEDLTPINSQNQTGNSIKQDSQESTNSSSPDKEDEKHDVGHDTHSMWEEAVKKHKEEQINKDKEDAKTEIEKKQQELEKLGEKETFKKILEERKKELEELKNELSKQSIAHGSSTNRDIRNINDIGRSKPILDWRYVLREAVKYEVDWSYKNATIEEGIVSPHLEEQPMPETEIVLDTSGSINDILLKNFLKECKNILQHSKLKVGCFDTEFYGFHEIRNEKDIENMKFEGGGGTNFDVAVNAFSRRVENKIIFTDGEANMPKKQINVIWIVFGNEEINPKGGKVIQIDDEQLKKLYLFEMNEKSKVKTR